jgi:hypothetical protein
MKRGEDGAAVKIFQRSKAEKFWKPQEGITLGHEFAMN